MTVYDEQYSDSKGWTQSNFGVLTPGLEYYYTRQIGAEFLRDANILELGFGNGEFAMFSQQFVAAYKGLEVNADLVAIANESIEERFSKKMHFSDSDWKEIDETFDGIFAFSVVEHLSVDDLKCFLSFCSSVLPSRGKLIIQFPEGTSPFGLANQYGDPTHQTVITEALLRHLIIGTKLEVHSYRSDLSTYSRVARIPFVGWKILDLMNIYSRFLQYILKLIFFPVSMGTRYNLNSFAILEKR